MIDTRRAWFAIRRFASASVALVTPPACAYCDRAVSPTSAERLCRGCRRTLVPAPGPVCLRCAGPIPEGFAPREVCHACRGRRLRFGCAFALSTYEGELREAVLRTKRPAEAPLAWALADELAKRAGEAIRRWAPDCVTAVPMHWRRRVWRRANSPERIAERLARRLQLPWSDRLLARRRHTEPQAGLPYSRRFVNVRGAFGPRRGVRLRAARVLLVDDILTTGATASSAAAALRRAGAADVAVAVVARAETPL